MNTTDAAKAREIENRIENGYSLYADFGDRIFYIVPQSAVDHTVVLPCYAYERPDQPAFLREVLPDSYTLAYCREVAVKQQDRFNHAPMTVCEVQHVEQRATR